MAAGRGREVAWVVGHALIASGFTPAAIDLDDLNPFAVREPETAEMRAYLEAEKARRVRMRGS